ncbi:MAG TPA: RodZ domain-containing protein [Candidatus Koribacter sp.]|jgi:cytoskeleton protein RodZ
MGSFGEKLRREREMRGISLDEIAGATKIGTRSLKALEDENFAILPGGIFNKGFVRAYARFLGLNEDEAVADYQTAANEQPVSVKQIAAQSAIAKANRLAAQQKSESHVAGGLVRALIFLVVAVGVAYGGYKLVHRGFFKALKRPSLHRQMKQQAAAAPAATPAKVPASQPSSAQGQSTPSTPTATASAAVAPRPAAEFTVGIKATKTSWLSVTADGKRTFQKTLQPNEQQDVTAKSRVQILIGNPSGTEISLNGKPLVLGGDLTHPRTVTVGAGGLME